MSRNAYTSCDWPEGCTRSPMNGSALFRVNPKGELGIFMCDEHRDAVWREAVPVTVTDGDPRVEALLDQIKDRNRSMPLSRQHRAARYLAAADAVDPVRAALRAPTDDLVGRIHRRADVWPSETRAVLAALAVELGVSGQG